MTWDDHKKNFARLARDGGYTIAQYAAEFNLNPNTARRYLRAFKEDTGGYGDVDAEGISNEAWLEQDLDEDEEEDEEVTRKLYGDDD